MKKKTFQWNEQTLIKYSADFFKNKISEVFKKRAEVLKQKQRLIFFLEFNHIDKYTIYKIQRLFNND